MDIQAEFDDLLNQLAELDIEQCLSTIDFDLSALDTLDLELPTGLIDV